MSALGTVTREVASGRSVVRVLGEDALVGWRDDLHGRVLDLASGCGTTPRLVLAESRWLRLDIGHAPDLVADITAPLPFADDIADAAVLSWFLYVAPDPAAVLAEIHRVLRPGGVLLATVPLVFPQTPEPRDLWRFTGDGIAQLLDAAGFGVRTIVPLGGRWSSCAFLLDPFLRPRRIVGPAVVRTSLWLDRITDRRFPRLPTSPIAHAVRAVA